MPDDSGHQAARCRCIVNGIDPDVDRPARSADLLIDLRPVGRGNREHDTLQMFRRKLGRQVFGVDPFTQRRELGAALRRHDAQLRAGIAQQLSLARGDRAAADEQYALSAQLQEYGQVIQLWPPAALSFGLLITLKHKRPATPYGDAALK